MNKLIVTGLAMSLAACGPLATGGVSSGSISDTIITIQNAAIAACGFVPIADTVRQILAAGNPKLQAASDVAKAICAAVTPTTRQTFVAVIPNVAGVRIVGAFVRVQ